MRTEAARWRAGLLWYRNRLAAAQVAVAARAGASGGATAGAPAADPGLRCLRGFCPAERVDELRAAARREGWVLYAAEPAEGDPVPTLLRPAGPARWLRPVLDLLGVLPGYAEPDVSPLFLLFLAIFFAMLVGDAGYGLVLLATTGVLARARIGVPADALGLSYLCAAATVLWGALTGMWFGVPALGQWPPLRALVLPALDAFAADPAPVMRLCLVVGACHLTLAHAWAARRAAGLRAVAELGWIAVVWGMYRIGGSLLTKGGGDPLASALLLCGAGALGVVLFGEQRGRGWWAGVGAGLARLPLCLLAVIGVLSDVVSYVRLFAVGLAAKEIAVAFNGMAADLGWGTPGAVFGAVAILVFGHGANLLLSAMSVLVHGVRLNLLEFSRHLDLSWAGEPYRPFRRLTAADLGE
ncbi:MAG: hypothetical protein HZA54_17520 [Planctomycetes bacterium]|nr:hypothetical protein [Planctomycetota bacterium]